MTGAERFRNWIDEVARFWADRLGSWAGTFIGAGIDAFFKILGKAASPKLKPLIDMLEKSGEVPPELKPLLDEVKDPTGEVAAMLAQGVGGGIVGGALGKITDALFNPLGYWAGNFKQNALLSEAHYIAYWLRGKLTLEQLDWYLNRLNLSKTQISVLKELSSVRLDPLTTIRAEWRGIIPPGTTKRMLNDQGIRDADIATLKQVSLFMPAAPDIVSWYAREVYEPDMIERYGLDSELPAYETTDFPKIGVDSTQAKNFWRAHWEHASYMQIREMLRRGLLSLDKTMPSPPTTEAGWAARDAEGEKAAFDWYRLVEIPPFWRARLTEMMYEVPTRVDVRRFWDMRTIDEERLRSIYHAQGYHGKDLDDYILWTKVYVAFPDLMARWKNGWITLDEVKTELTALGMPAARVDEMIETKIKTAKPERTTAERDLTKTDIYKGIKADRITRDQGVELLMDLGFDEDEADVLLDTNVPEDITDKVVEARELSKTDIRAGLKAEELTEEQVVERLQRLRYSLLDSQLLLRIFKSTIKPPVEEEARQLAKADITLGVKNGLLTPEDGYMKLQELRFTPQDAEYLLLLKAEKSPFSPVSFAEFKERTQKYRRAAGMEIVEMPEEIKTAASLVVTLTGEVEALERSIAEEKRGLIPEVAIPEETAKRLKSLQVKRNRAISKLEKAKSEYDRLVAEWRHGLP